MNTVMARVKVRGQTPLLMNAPERQETSDG